MSAERPWLRQPGVGVVRASGVSMTRSLFVLALAAVAAGASSLQAQVRPQAQEPKAAVPSTHLPPPGMCRIWLENVPPAQQPAPTDCASAARNLPRNGRLIYNDAARNPRLPIVKSLKEPPPAPRKVPDEPPPVKPPVGRDGKPIKPDRPN